MRALASIHRASSKPSRNDQEIRKRITTPDGIAHCDKEAERAHDEQARLSFKDAAASRELARHWLELAGENSR
jgi:hypothetical protein